MINNWSVGERTRHTETHRLFLHKMNDQGFFQVNWISVDDNEVDVFIKKFPGSLFENHSVKFNGK